MIVLAFSIFAAAAEPPPLVLRGATIVDVSQFGRSTSDAPDAVIIASGGRITSVGRSSDVAIPPNATVLDVSGKFIVPGLIDGFAGLNSQSQANAYLYMGVTSIVGVGDRRRGRLVKDASPSPHIFPLETVAYTMKDGRAVLLDEAEAVRDVEKLAASGVRVLLLHYPLTLERTRAVVARAKALGLVTIGELGFTRYGEAIEVGVNAFVHTSRYSLGLAPEELRLRVAADAFGPPRIEFYQLLVRMNLLDPKVDAYAQTLGSGKTALIPTLSLEYLDLPDHENPWKEPVGRILDPKGIHLPADPATGKHASDSPELFPEGFPLRILALEERYRKAGARYLAGSGTSAFGTMPGISLHTELALLVRIGLTPREALAAATANVAGLFSWDVGAIRPGARADLVILDANPTEDIRNLKRIDRVVFGGQVVRRDALLEHTHVRLRLQ